MNSQVEQLKEHFERYPSISNVEAQMVYKIRALPRRICDLKEQGYVFDSQWRKDATGQRYKRYTLISSP
tara:strand:+ start:487 stop:693 length:207 start_codon:yes stop_codon:yes gene_type:complete